jgi:hypothetical protein
MGLIDVQVEVTLPFSADSRDLTSEKGGEPFRLFYDVLVVRVVSELKVSDSARAFKALRHMHQTLLTKVQSRTLLLNKVSHVKFIWPEGSKGARFLMFKTKDFINGPPPKTIGL